MAPKSSKDHWAFLEEIEAPMWIDLTVEEKSNCQDIDDGWFFTSHLFHQCSSRQLKAAFAHSGDGAISSDSDMKEPSSPKLPSSVSRSRGKHYATKKWGGDNCDLQGKKQHPVNMLSGKSSWMSSAYGDEIKPKLSFVNSKGTLSRKVSLVSDKCLMRNARENKSREIFIHGESESHLSFKPNKDDESNTSTIASMNDHQSHRRNLDVSNVGFGRTSGLLSTMRTSLRKSCVTRQASRVVIKNDSKESRVHTSSSSKSSVGSSSTAAPYGRRSMSMLMQKKEETPDSRSVARMTEATKTKLKDSNVSKVCSHQVKKTVYDSKRECTSNVTKSAKLEAAKSKMQDQNQALHAKASIPLRVNGQSSLTGAARSKEIRVIGSNRWVGVGKENAAGRVSSSLTSCQVGIIAGGTVSVQRNLKHNVPLRKDNTGLLDPKGKSSRLGTRNHSTNPARAAYFR